MLDRLIGNKAMHIVFAQQSFFYSFLRKSKNRWKKKENVEIVYLDASTIAEWTVKKKRKICIISNFDTDTDIIGFFVFFPFCLRFCSALRTLYLRSFETNKFLNEWIINRFLFCFYFVFKTIKILILFFFWKRVVFYIDGNHFLSVPNYIQQILSISI